MYSLTFCVRFLLPERQQWKPAVQSTAVRCFTFDPWSRIFAHVVFYLIDVHGKRLSPLSSLEANRYSGSCGNYKKCSNVENAPVGGGPAAPVCGARFWRRPPSPTGRRRAQTPPSRPFALCRHIAGWTQACNYGSRYVAIATQPVPRLQIRPVVHN